MGSYAIASSRTDRSKAIAAVAAVHIALAFVILTGLNVRMVSQTVDRLATFTVIEPTPPPPPPEPAPKMPSEMKKPAGAPAPRAEPSPVVAPPPRLPLPSPIPAAKMAGAGTAPSSGAASSGNGTGAGGSGDSLGGGGAGFTPARRITKIPNSEYRHLAATGLSRGRVGVTIKVEPDGSASNCRVARSSGDSGIDALMCRLTLHYVSFEPARDPAGRPVAQDVTFFPNWWRP